MEGGVLDLSGQQYADVPYDEKERLFEGKLVVRDIIEFVIESMGGDAPPDSRP